MKRGAIWGAVLVAGGLFAGTSAVWTNGLPGMLEFAVFAADPPSRLTTPANESSIAEPAPPVVVPPAPSRATPVSGRGDSVRAVIERELPHATADERDIWFEQLKELPPGVVEDLLHVRKQFREMVPPLTPTITPTPLLIGTQPVVLPSGKPLPPTDPAWQASLEAIHQLRIVTLHNLANADTPGYRRLEPVVFPDTGGHGLIWGGTRVDLQPGPIQRTFRPSDVALDGIGWFAVEDGEHVVVTRRGSFSVREGHLMLPLGPQRFGKVLPEVAIPDSVDRVEIMSSGEVGGWSKGAAGLSLIGQVQVALLTEAGQAAVDAGLPLTRDTVDFVLPKTAGVAALVTLSLEKSNVHVDHERERLRRIDDWCQQVGTPNAFPHLFTEPGPTR